MRNFIVSLVSVIFILQFLSFGAEAQNFGEDESLNSVVEPGARNTEIVEKVNFEELEEPDLFAEASLQFHGLNSGTQFLALALTENAREWLYFGAKLFLPLNYNEKTDLFMAQIFSRINILNTRNQFYFEPSVTQGLAVQKNVSDPFFMYGLNLGYLRNVDRKFKWGVSGGVDYGTKIQGNDVNHSRQSFYTKAAVVTSYTF